MLKKFGAHLSQGK